MLLPDHLYVCMYVFYYEWIITCSCQECISYLYHKGEPQRDEEIDGEERDGEGGKTETMYVCMYEWMDVYAQGGGIGVDLLCDGISDACICPAGVLASRPDM